MDHETRWYDQIRTIVDTSSQEDWLSRLNQFNNRPPVKKAGTTFSLPKDGHPPPWFNGDITALNPGEWVLVVMDNPDADMISTLDLDDDETPDAWWNHWRTFNAEHADWTEKPVYPWLVETAAATFGIAIDGNSVEGHQFATNRMLFVDFCPYASSKWPTIEWERDMKPIANRDPGISRARQIRQLIFDHGQPKCVLCFGRYATYDVKGEQFKEHHMSRKSIGWKGQQSGVVHLYAGTYKPVNGEQFLVLGVPEVRDWKRNPALQREVIEAYVNGTVDRSALSIEDSPRAWEVVPSQRRASRMVRS